MAYSGARSVLSNYSTVKAETEVAGGSPNGLANLGSNLRKNYATLDTALAKLKRTRDYVTAQWSQVAQKATRE